MKFATTRLVFIKEGRELLRDRRTIFVNVVLPVLLYPLMALFAIQVMSLTRPTEDTVPQIATIDVPEGLLAHLPQPGALTVGEKKAKALREEKREQEDQAVADLPIDQQEARRRELAQARGLDDARRDAGRLDQVVNRVEIGQDDDLRGAVSPLMAWIPPANPAAKKEAEPDPTLVAAALPALRKAGVVAVLARTALPQDGLADGDRYHLLIDNAHRHHTKVSAVIERSLKAHRQSLVDDRIAAAELPAELIKPVLRHSISMAPPAEASRSKLAAIIPILLVFMALSGAFYPALDLIAGERERGTLESLLSWPGGRAEIFTGKLLVVILAGVVSVVLNLASLGITAGIINDQISQGAEGAIAFDLSFGVGILVMCLIALLPLIIMLSAISLALAGMAASYKEAQNYLSPLMLVVILPAVLAMAPNAQPTLALDLVPIVGPILALKASLQEPTIPWQHVLLATAASTALAAVVVAWSVRLLNSEGFLYPGLVRAGWGRFRKWGERPSQPAGLEAMGLFAVCTGALLFLGPQFKEFGTAAMVAGPLVACLLVPSVLFGWLGAYKPQNLFRLRPPPLLSWPLTMLMIPIGVCCSISIGQLQGLFLGEHPPGPSGFEFVPDLVASGGLPLLLVCLALAPAVCEEALCRGPLLSGLTKAIGPLGGILVSAFCFAVMHASPWRLFPQLVLGIAMAVLVWRTRSIWPAVLLHLGHNGLAVLTEPSVGLVDEAALNDWLADLDTPAWAGLLAASVLVGSGLIWATPKARDPEPARISAGPGPQDS